MENEARLAAYQAMVEARLASCVPAEGRLEEAMRYGLLAGGKRLRPVLALEFCRLCGGDVERALDAACGLELLHTYSLIHDDLPCMDDDALRRGKPSSHVVYGEWLALLAGDALQAEAFRLVLDSPLPPEAKLEAARILARAAGRAGICGGQYLDLAAEGASLREEGIITMYAKKTGALFRAACEMGCAAAGASAEMKRAAGDYGAALGFAFQLRDDLLDLVSTDEALGKPVGSDARNGKSTLAARLGLEETRRRIGQTSLAALRSLRACFPEPDFLTWLTETLTRRES